MAISAQQAVALWRKNSTRMNNPTCQTYQITHTPTHQVSYTHNTKRPNCPTSHSQPAFPSTHFCYHFSRHVWHYSDFTGIYDGTVGCVRPVSTQVTLTQKVTYVQRIRSWISLPYVTTHTPAPARGALVSVVTRPTERAASRTCIAPTAMLPYNYTYVRPRKHNTINSLPSLFLILAYLHCALATAGPKHYLPPPQT